MSSTSVSKAELYGLFAPHRPEPEAFEQAVEARIAEREAAGEKGAQLEAAEAPAPEDSAPEATFLRRAASWMPLAPTGKGGGGSAALKTTYTVCALPAILFALAVASFIASARSILNLSKQAVPSAHGPGLSTHPLQDPVNQDLKRSRWLIMLLQMTTIIALGVSCLASQQGGQNTLVLALLVAMGALTLTVRGLLAMGALSRYHVSRVSTGLLVTVYGGCFIWSSSFPILRGEAWIDIGWSSLVILVGLIGTQALGQGRKAGVGAALAVLFVVLIVQPIGGGRSSAGSVYSQLEDTQLDPGALGRWRGAAAMYEALEAAGEDLPDMSSTAQSINQAIISGDKIHPTVLTAGARMGLIDSEHWQRLAQRKFEKADLESLLRKGGSFNPTAYYEYQFHMLVHSRELTAEENRFATEAIEAAWDKADLDPRLDKLVAFARALDLLGHPDRVDAHRDRVHAQLREHYRPIQTFGPLRSPGGFAPNPARSDYSDSQTTWSAIELMSRLGVPEGIDLWKVRTFLTHEARALPLPIELPTAYLRSLPRAALLRLEHALELPPRGWLAGLFAERLLLASVLLVALCLLAIRLAPPFPAGPGGGARP